LIRTGSLPRTSSGKIQRTACRAAFLAEELSVVASWDSRAAATANAGGEPRTPVEAQLAAIWARVLGHERVGIHDNFFELGGASIQVVQIAEAAAEAGLALAPEMFFQHQTIADLAGALASRDIVLVGAQPEVSATPEQVAA
jgi:hypothetical protein